MEKFISLPKEKQARILEAGYQCFGKMGYKKASAQDIATAAGISKGMVFHYFGSKKGLYHYLIQSSFQEILTAFQQGFIPDSTDFFDRILTLANCKINCLKRHPSLLSFFMSLYTETAPEVIEETQKIQEKASRFRACTLLRDPDIAKFKDPSYAELSRKLLMNYGESYASDPADVGQLERWRTEFADCVHMLKLNLYKEEYL